MPSITKDLPLDVILQICRFCDHWQDVVTLRKVSKIFDPFFRHREIWADLVSACANPPNEPPICFSERPLYTYSTGDLQRVFKRWKTSEIGLKTLSSQTEGTVRTLEMEYPLYSGWSILAPGGRWLISFTEDVAAVYYDLESPTPTPFPIIPAQLSDEAHETDVFLSGFDIDASSLCLSFRIAFSYNPDEADMLVNVIQMWEFGVVFDEAAQESRLVAQQLNLFRLRFGEIKVVSLAGDYLLLRAEELSIGNGSDPDEKLLLICWPTVPEGKVAPVKLLLFDNHGEYRAPALLRSGAIVRSTSSDILLYDFTDLEHYTAAPPNEWAPIDSLYTNRISRCHHNLGTGYGPLPMLSDPYYCQTSRVVGAPLPRAEIILLGEKGMGSIKIDDLHTRIYRHGETEPPPAAPCRTLGYYDWVHKHHSKSSHYLFSYFTGLDKVIFGYRHTLVSKDGRLRLLSVAKTRGDTGKKDGDQEEDDQLVVSDLKIPVSAMQRVQFDESIGRIIVIDESRNSCKIYDFFV